MKSADDSRTCMNHFEASCDKIPFTECGLISNKGTHHGLGPGRFMCLISGVLNISDF